jgi:hypothetical protein
MKGQKKTKTRAVDPRFLRAIAGMLRALAKALDDLADGRPVLADEARAALKGA